MIANRKIHLLNNVHTTYILAAPQLLQKVSFLMKHFLGSAIFCLQLQYMATHSVWVEKREKKFTYFCSSVYWLPKSSTPQTNNKNKFLFFFQNRGVLHYSHYFKKFLCYYFPLIAHCVMVDSSLFREDVGFEIIILSHYPKTLLFWSRRNKEKQRQLYFIKNFLGPEIPLFDHSDPPGALNMPKPSPIPTFY